MPVLTRFGIIVLLAAAHALPIFAQDGAPEPTGEVEQYRLFDAGDGRIGAELVREFIVGSQTEGCDVNGHLTADVEGIALQTASGGNGYLIASAQGASEFVVYDRAIPADGSANPYIGTFAIIETDTVDAVSGSDGIDVTDFALGDAYPDGLFVTQDDLNLNPSANQNFKLVSWRTIAEALGLIIDVGHDPRVTP